MTYSFSSHFQDDEWDALLKKLEADMENKIDRLELDALRQLMDNR